MAAKHECVIVPNVVPAHPARPGLQGTSKYPLVVGCKGCQWQVLVLDSADATRWKLAHEALHPEVKVAE